LLDTIVVPLVRQLAQALRAEGHLFNVFTPSGSVRLMSERNAEDFIELFLDTTGTEPRVVGRTRRSRGSRVLESEEALGAPARCRKTTCWRFCCEAIAIEGWSDGGTIASGQPASTNDVSTP
jgi:hypothetical protein